MKKGCPYGTHRVIEPKGVLPQPAEKIDNTMEIYDKKFSSTFKPSISTPPALPKSRSKPKAI